LSQMSFSSSTSSDINLFGGATSNGPAGTIPTAATAGAPSGASSVAGSTGAMLTPSASQEDGDTVASIGEPASDPNISVIHDAARLTNWDTVLELCNTQPQYAHYAGPDGWTALHHACNRRCPRPDVVEALIRAYPDAMLDLEEKGMTPLHYACRFKAPREAVRLLLELYPRQGRAAVSRRDKKGRTPLFYAIRYDAPDGVVELLLQVDPSVVLEEQTRDANTSPLALAWTVWAEKMEGRNTLRPFLSPTTSSTTAEGEAEATTTASSPEERLELLKTKDKLYKHWKKVHKLLRAAYGFHKPEQGQNREFRILHATANIQCHVSLFQLALALHPEQASQHDFNDLTTEECTVLHLAAASCATGDLARLVIASLIRLYPAALSVPDATDTKSLPLHIIVEKKHRFQDDGIEIIYEAYPQAASIADADGRLALHRAAGAVGVSSKSWSVENNNNNGQNGNNPHQGPMQDSSIVVNLVRLHPEAASVADNSGRLPLHWIAQTCSTWTRECQAIYDAHPAAIRTRTSRQQHARLALHVAAAAPNARNPLLSKLVELNPRAASQPDATGKLPLHLLCETGKEFSEEVYEAFPNAIREAEDNDRAWTALQMAAACSSAEDDSSQRKHQQQQSSSQCIIDKLVELNPEAALLVDRQHGRTALHWACASGKEWDTGLEALLRAHPDAVLHPDKRGCLPFHVAALRYCKVQKEEEGKDPPPVFKNRSTLRARLAPPRPEFTNHVEVLFELLRARPDILGAGMIW